MNTRLQHAPSFTSSVKGENLYDDIHENSSIPNSDQELEDQSRRLSTQLQKSQICNKQNVEEDYFNYKPVLEKRKPKTKSIEASLKKSTNKENNQVLHNQKNSTNVIEKARTQKPSPKRTQKENGKRRSLKPGTNEQGASKPSISHSLSKKNLQTFKTKAREPLQIATKSQVKENQMEKEAIEFERERPRCRDLPISKDYHFLENSLTQSQNVTDRSLKSLLSASRYQDKELLEIVLGPKKSQEEQESIPFKLSSSNLITPRNNSLYEVKNQKHAKITNLLELSSKRKNSKAITVRQLGSSHILKHSQSKGRDHLKCSSIFSERKRYSENSRMFQEKLNFETEKKMKDKKLKKHNISLTTNSSNISIRGKQKTTNNCNSKTRQTSKKRNQLDHLDTILKCLRQQTKQSYQIIENIKRKSKNDISISQTLTMIKQIHNSLKNVWDDKQLVQLNKLHSGTILLQYVFLDLVQTDYVLQTKSSDSLVSIFLNTLEYTTKNIRILNEFVTKNLKLIQKDTSSFRPVSANDLITQIKQNTQIAVSFLKKICRLQKSYADKLKDLQIFATQIETCQQSKKFKKQIVKEYTEIKTQQNQLLISSTNQNPFKQSQGLQRSISKKEGRTKKTQTQGIQSKKSFEKCQSYQNITKKSLTESYLASPQKSLKISTNSEIFRRSAQKENNNLSNTQKFQKNLTLNVNDSAEPSKVRANRHYQQRNNQQQIQFHIAPTHLSSRASSQLREPYLPSENVRGQAYTLVLDLDETLVHFDAKTRRYRARPGAQKFLSEMSKYYELVVFTAGLKDYADWILNDFDRHSFIQHRLYRDHCKYKNGVYVKDLSKLGRDLEKILIVDNIEENFGEQPDNGIHIKSWFSDENDKELEKLLPFLKELVEKQVKDVRQEVIQSKFMILKREREKQLNKIKEREEEGSDSSEEETPKKKVTNKKKNESSSEEEEDSSDDDKKKKSPAKKSENSEESDENEDESELVESEDEVSVPPKNQKIVSHKKSEFVVKLEKQTKELKGQIIELEERVEEKDNIIQEKEGNVVRLSQKIKAQDEEISKLREKCEKKKHKVNEHKQKLERTKHKKKGHKNEIEDLKRQVAQLENWKAEYDEMKSMMDGKNSEIGVLKAKLNLDLIEFKVNIVAEYPDMIEDNNHLYKESEKLNVEIEQCKKVEYFLKTECYELQESGKEKDKKIRQLEKEKENLQKKVNEHIKTQKQMSQKILEQEARIAQHLIEMDRKNNELEERLETVSKLIQKNEQFSQQLKINKTRLEKFKKEQVETFKKQIGDRDSEIEVLKEMVKGNQLEVRVKEKEIQRLKFKMVHVEGQQLALRQQQNLQYANNQPLVPLPTMQSQNKKTGQLSQLRQTPQKYQMSQKSQLNNIQRSNNHLPSIERQNDAFSQGSVSNSQKASSKSSQYRNNLQKGGQQLAQTKSPKAIRQTTQKRIDELDEEDTEINLKNMPRSPSSELRQSPQNDIQNANVRVSLSQKNDILSAYQEQTDESRVYSPEVNNHSNGEEDIDGQYSLQQYDEGSF